MIQQNCTEAEHIIIDGGSIDDTINIVKDFAKKHDHIKWISEKDQGQSDAMNKGIALAKADFISFLNVDDFYEAGTLNRVVKIFETVSEHAFVVGNCKIWNDEGELLQINRPSKLNVSDLVKGYAVNQFPVNPSAYFYDKSLHEIVGYYDVNDHYSMDMKFIFKAVQIASVYYFDEPWGNFRLIKGTKTYEEEQNGNGYYRRKNICLKHSKKTGIINRFIFSVLYDFNCIKNSSKKSKIFFSLFSRIKYSIKIIVRKITLLNVHPK